MEFVKNVNEHKMGLNVESFGSDILGTHMLSTLFWS
jgi:hypothetical protein